MPSAYSYLGEIQMFAYDLVPAGWAGCDGSLLSTSQHQVLYKLIGHTYGGDGAGEFRVPNFVSRIPSGLAREPAKVAATSETRPKLFTANEQHQTYLAVSFCMSLAGAIPTFGK